MRVVDSLLFPLAFLVNSIVCPVRDGVHPNDFENDLEIVPSTPEETKNIRIMHEDRRLHEVVGNINMVARGQTIIGYDGHCRSRSHLNFGIFNAEGEPVFQNRANRADIWEVDFKQARDWGVYDPSPSDPPLPPSYYKDMLQYSAIPYPSRVTQRDEAEDRARDRSRDRVRDKSIDRSRERSRDRAAVRGRGKVSGNGGSGGGRGPQ